MKRFTGNDNCHIMIAVDADENRIGFIEHSFLDDMGNEHKSYKPYLKSDLMKIHASEVHIGHDVAYSTSIDG